MWTGDYKMALSSIRASKWRSTLTMMGIIIGISSVVTVASLGEGLKRQIVGQVNQLGSDIVTIRPGKVVTKNSEGRVSGINPLALLSTSTLTDADIDTIRAIPSIASATPMSIITNSVSFEDKEMNNAYVVATTPEADAMLGQKTIYGAFFTGDDAEQAVAVIGPGIAENLFAELNPVGQSFQISGTTFLVRGVLESFAGGILSTTGIDLNYAVFIPYQTGKQLTEGRSQINQILAQAKQADQVQQTIDDVQHTILTNHGGQDNFTILKQDELLNVSNSIVDSAATVIASIAGISLLVGGVGILNIMLVSVSERTREIGIRKAIGATNRQILNQFLVEGLVLSVVGGIIGIATSIGINFLLRIYTDFKPVVSIPIVVIAAGVSIIIGVVFSTAPAIKAARKNPIDALRGE